MDKLIEQVETDLRAAEEAAGSLAVGDRNGYNKIVAKVKLLVPRIQSIASKDRSTGNALSSRFNALNEKLKNAIAPTAVAPASSATSTAPNSGTEPIKSSATPEEAPKIDQTLGAHQPVADKLQEYKQRFETMQKEEVWSGEGKKLWDEFQKFGQTSLAPLTQLRPFPAVLSPVIQLYNSMSKEVPAKLNEMMKSKPQSERPPIATPPVRQQPAANPAAAVDLKSKRLPYPEAQKLHLMNPQGYLDKAMKVELQSFCDNEVKKHWRDSVSYQQKLLADFTYPLDHPEIEPKAQQTQKFHEFVEQQIKIADSMLQEALNKYGVDWEDRCNKIVEKYSSINRYPDPNDLAIDFKHLPSIEEVTAWVSRLRKLADDYPADAEYVNHCFSAIYPARKSESLRNNINWLKNDSSVVNSLGRNVGRLLESCRNGFSFAEAPTQSREQLLQPHIYQKRVDTCNLVLKLCDIIELVESTFFSRGAAQDVNQVRERVRGWINAYPDQLKAAQEEAERERREQQERADKFKRDHLDPLSSAVDLSIRAGGSIFEFEAAKLKLKLVSSRFDIGPATWVLSQNSPAASWHSAIRLEDQSPVDICASFDGDLLSFWSSENSSLLSCRRSSDDPAVWVAEDGGSKIEIHTKETSFQVSLTAETLNAERSRLFSESGAISPSIPQSQLAAISPIIAFALLIDYCHLWLDAEASSIKKKFRTCKKYVSGTATPAIIGEICCGWGQAKEKCVLCDNWHQEHARAILCSDHGWSTQAERCISCDDWIISENNRLPAYICHSCYSSIKYHCCKVGPARTVEIPNPRD